ncbi:hypothetical protein [Serratia aquatilis]|uniref:Uncharacterized protein n=1 Tax=Serratia aquatilis TaxID=1737515 RepID=A0ABV6EE74_9GAMM
MSRINQSSLAQLHEIEVNPEAVQQLKSPPPEFKDKLLSSCIQQKADELEQVHVFG